MTGDSMNTAQRGEIPEARRRAPRERGVALIIVILVTAFLLAIGVGVLSLSGTGPKVSNSLRQQELAFQAAEAGFDAAWRYLNDASEGGAFLDFSGLCRTTYGGADGLDEPLDVHYFRKLTDEELWTDVTGDPTNAIFPPTQLPQDARLSYVVFMINDEPPGAVPNYADGILVCIGRGPQNTYIRLEIVLEISS